MRRYLNKLRHRAIYLLTGNKNEYGPVKAPNQTIKKP